MFNEAKVSEHLETPTPGFVYDLEMDGHPSFVANGLLVHNSATPIYNYGGEFFSVMDALKPGSLGRRDEFLREWCVSYYSDKPRIKDPKAFGMFLRDSALMIRRTRRDVSRELPALSQVVHEIDSDPKALDAVKDSATELAKIILAQNKGFEIMKASSEFSNTLRQATGIAKAPYVAEFVRMFLEQGEPVVLFGWHRECFAKGTPVLMFDGTT